MASWMLSLPPDETVPHTPSGEPGPPPTFAPPSMVAVMATTSLSYFTALGQRSVCNGFDCELIAYTSLRNEMCSASPLYTAPDA